jgi:hypothetical protein
MPKCAFFRVPKLLKLRSHTTTQAHPFVNTNKLVSCYKPATNKMPTSGSQIGQKIFWHHYGIAEQQQHKTADGLWIWATKLRRFFEGHGTDRKAELSFMHFYLTDTSGLCLLFLPVNIISLLCAILVIVQGLLGSSTKDPAFLALAPAVVETVIWIVLSMFVQCFFVGV